MAFLFSLIVIFIVLAVAPPLGILLSVLAIVAALTSKPSDKDAERLPKCPSCGYSKGWTVTRKYLKQRWYGTPVYTYLTAACPNCGLHARLRYNDPGWGNWGHKGWMFE